VLDEVIQSYHETQCDKCIAAEKRVGPVFDTSKMPTFVPEDLRGLMGTLVFMSNEGKYYVLENFTMPDKED
jgi:hypothetical protein